MVRQDGKMEVSKEHVVDASEQNADGLYDYYYAYRLFSFKFDELALVARSYDHEPQKVHFLSKQVGVRRELLTHRDIQEPLFVEACRYLQEVEGMVVIEVLKDGGYQMVDFK